MTEPTVGTLRVNGATLHYEVRGRGPLLLLIPGGTGGAASLAAVAADLADASTVVTYDPRGMGGSTLDDPETEQSVAEHAEDAARLLDLLSPDAPARVFGSSSGAIAALHLLLAHPERVQCAVVHEPPVVEVLPDAAAHRALLARVQETFRERGPMPAMAVFAAGLSKDGDTADPAPATELPPQAAARAEQTLGALPYFVGRIVPAFMSYAPDVTRLATLSDRLVLACGEESRGELPYRPAAFLAERLGTELRHFPGGHTGLTTHPAAFAERLREALHA
ncbi:MULTISPECIES: alpha/beta hydrolase [Streptomyces]|uniref:Alpha/beta hydrolase n=1 Tax=Streptomyces venezuelae TaxID=54571 RepID=A0A5P2BJT3_STRVZ|nr:MULTISPECIES: alpha/beta hydrolase [Streptomyces]NEA03264.1 alpha/beta hydrolase [Streptomyces sp. SID10116]MYY83502.1 alpha/beta fold hydrolase [Streptomyces sp. SID335]MYZ13445.1 alpha/beta fold hydrolase [Streptomyces sp. SID337]NDZ89165.1 alpha/beta hydrolase [Streptomyces sp. SID10115]NEB43870.1 alpha/beta hydrolase [Streptomyces sp. SID339]